MKHKKKSPLLAAILNFLFFGAGYIYIGKRKIFAWLMILAFVVMSVEFFLGNIGHLDNLAGTHTISMTLVAVAVAVDVYLLSK